MSDDSQFVVTLGRSGRVVKRAGPDLDSEFADSGRVAGKKRSIKDRLGNGHDNTYKRQRGETSQETHGLHDSRLGKGDLRLKLMKKGISRRAGNEDPPSNVDLRDTLLRKTNRQSPTGTKVIRHPEPTIRVRESVPERRDTLYNDRRSPVDPIDAYDARRRRNVLDSRDDYNGGRRRGMVDPEDHYDDRRRHAFEPRDFNDDRRRSTMEPHEKYGDDRRMVEPSDIYGDGRRSMLRQVSSSRNVHDLPATDQARTAHSSRALDGLDLRRRSPDGFLRPSSSRVLSPDRDLEDLHRRTMVRAYNDRKPNSYMPNDVLGQSRAIGTTSVMMRPSTRAATLKPVVPFVSQLPPPPSISAQKIMHPGEIPTVDGFLRYLGLEKYSINFKAEEVDMHALRQMSDVDLKEMGVPLGPRKKILQALMPRPKRQA